MKKWLSISVFLLCLGGVSLTTDVLHSSWEACGKASFSRKAVYMLRLTFSVLQAEAAPDALLSARSQCPATSLDAMGAAPPAYKGKTFRRWLAKRDASYNEETSRVMARILSPTSNTVDVGTFKGEVLAEMLSFAPRGEHWGFEPLPHLAKGLKQRFRHKRRVHIIAAALSDRIGTTTFQHVVTNPGYSGIKQRSYIRKERVVQIRVPVTTLDATIPPQTPIHLLKVDVEGAELQVLRGATKTILRTRPVIVFEHGKGASDRYGTTPTKLYRLLHDVCQMEVNTMARWLQYLPGFTKREFEQQYAKGHDWYFIASPKEKR